MQNEPIIYLVYNQAISTFLLAIFQGHAAAQKEAVSADSVHIEKVKFIPEKILQICIKNNGASHSIVQS